MPSMTNSQTIFSAELVRQLNRLGNFAKPEFRVPGTRTRLDIYIASPVRAFVEIKFLRSPSPSAVQGLVQQAEHLRTLFGEEIVPILVAGGEGWRPSSMKELRDAGFFIHILEGAALDSASAAHSAKEIRNFLTHRPYQFKGMKPKPVRVMHPAMPLPAPPSEADHSPIAKSRRPSPHSDREHERIEPHFEAIESRAHVDLNVLEAAMMEAVPASDIFADVLVSMKSILSPEQFEVLEHELAAFSEEYRHAHYTACGLRIGRTLEHVIYALAREWGVSINRTTLQVLASLNGSFEQLSRVLIAYATADESEKAKRKKAVRDQAGKVSGKLFELVSDLDSDLRPEATGVVVNVESILRDIRRQFVRRERVLNTVDSIIREDICRKILGVRNDAAHASTTGARRELSREEIDAAVEHLRTVLFLFGNVAFAVAEKDPA